MTTFIILVTLICAYAKNTTFITSLEGHVTEINCGIGYYGSICQWFHNGNKIQPDDSKYIFQKFITEDTCEILIPDTNSLTDSGVWKCEIKYNDTDIFYSKEFTLKVENFRDHQIIVYKGTNAEIVEGQELVLICLVNDMINTKISWISSKNANANKIVFKNISRYDSGNYTCHAMNSFGYGNTISTVIDVKHPPKFKMVKIIPKSHTMLQSSTTFSCIAEGNPQPRYSWTKLKTHSDNRDIIANESQFSIMNINYSSEGQYACQISNNINGIDNIKISKPMSLNIKGAPIIDFDKSSNMNVLISPGKSVKFSVKFCSFPYPRSSYWVINHYLVLEANNSFSRFLAFPLEKVLGTSNCYMANLTINPIYRRDAGTIMFNVRNSYGTQHYTINLTVLEVMEDTNGWEKNNITEYRKLQKLERYPNIIVKSSHLRILYYFRTTGLADNTIKIIRYTIMGLTAVLVGYCFYTI